jgi:ribonuclease J
MLSLVKPRFFVPVHGEYRQLSQHGRVAARVFEGRDPKPEILLAENGDILQFDLDGARIAGKAPVGRILIDDTRTGEVGDEVLRDRRHLAEDGLVVPVVAINKQTGMLEGVPDIITRGFVMENSAALLADASRLLAEVVDQASLEERTDQGLIKEKLRVELRRFFRKRSGRRPFVLPVIMEI